MLTYAYKDTITYWAPGTADGFGGRNWPAPIQLCARWEDRNETVMNQQGDEIVSQAVVFVLQDVAIQGWMYRGISAQVDPTAQPGASEIRALVKVPDLRRNSWERRAIL